MVPRAEPRSYYGRPVLKSPVWTPEIPLYFWTGGLGGASAGLAFGAELTGNEELARRAWANALAAMAVSPVLLISDLGVRRRFLNMLRVFKVTSPMSVGSWLLAGVSSTTALAATSSATGRRRREGRAAGAAAAVLGLPLATYTAALVANTAVPVWHEARRELPFVFAASAAASAGAAAVVTTPARHAGPARALALGGGVAELVAAEVMERRLGELGEPYRHGRAGAFAWAAKATLAAGTGVLARRGRRERRAAVAGAGLLAAGSLLERWAVFRAGFQSAEDPRFTVGPQRERLSAPAGSSPAAGPVGQ
jgi:hypothetical protein